MKINDILITEPSVFADKLGKHFSEISIPKKYLPEFQKVRYSQMSQNFELDKFEAYNAEFSLREFKEALVLAEATAAGEDLNMHEILNHLPLASG